MNKITPVLRRSLALESCVPKQQSNNVKSIKQNVVRTVVSSSECSPSTHTLSLISDRSVSNKPPTKMQAGAVESKSGTPDKLPSNNDLTTEPQKLNLSEGKSTNNENSAMQAPDKTVSDNIDQGATPLIKGNRISLDTLPEGIKNKIIGSHDANPNFYDYIHHLNLKENGRFTLASGAGQCLDLAIDGYWELLCCNDDSKYTLHIYDIEVERGSSTEQFQDINADFSIIDEEVTMPKPCIWNLPEGETEPTHTFFSKLVFDIDPVKMLFNQGQIVENTNLFYLLNSDTEDSENMYYSRNGAIDSEDTD